MLFQQCLFEFLGTMILVLMGDGVCAACTLNKSKAQGAGWVVITLAWGFAVMCGVLVAGPVSGAHLNPAVTFGLALAGLFPWCSVVPYIIAQMIGGFVGAVLVYAFYVDHFAATSDNPDGMLGCFCTMPAIDHKTVNFFSEFLAIDVKALARHAQRGHDIPAHQKRRGKFGLDILPDDAFFLGTFHLL